MPVPASDQPDFLYLRPVAVGGGPTTVVAADFDLDGDLDVATSDARNDSVSIVAWQDGGFLSPPTVLPVGTFPTGLAACDLDRDGRADLAVAHFSFDFDRISVLLNRSAGGVPMFESATFDVGARSSSIVCADLDGDGDRDLAVTLFDEDAAMTYFNDGDGDFLPGQREPVESAPSAIDAGDLDGDGLVDLAVANDQADSISVLLNDPAAPGHLLPRRSVATGSAPTGVVLADLDRDGDLDMATSNRGEPTATVLRNDGVASSWQRADVPVAGLSLAIAAGDFDCDGGTDLAVASDGPDRVALLFSDPSAPGAFHPFAAVVVSDDTRSLAAGDFDDNGHLDLATAHFRPDLVSALVNQENDTFHFYQRGGLADDFAGATEPAHHSPALEKLLETVSSAPALEFDERIANRWFGHSFFGLPRRAVGAELEITAQAVSGSTDNDSLCFEIVSAENGRYGWCSRFEDLPEAGGQWRSGDRATFRLDLGRLPADDRGTSSVLDLLADGELDVIVQDDTAIDHLRLALRTCCPCAGSPPVRRQGGLEDEFADSPEGTAPRADLDRVIRDRTGHASLDFDEAVVDRWIGHTFTGLPSCIESARLELRARAAFGGAGTDSLYLQLVDAEMARFAWGLAMADLPGAGGDWQQGQEATFVLDLAELPPSGSGVTDLLRELENGSLDLLVQDDTALDFARLIVTPCCAPPEPPGNHFQPSPTLPGYDVQSLLTPQSGEPIVGDVASDCIDETLCISGALPGRSEIFVRVVGPKPNGKLWPTLVKFSTSQVEVWVRQRATGDIEYYHLPGARPGYDELPGLFDRTGFDPVTGIRAHSGPSPAPSTQAPGRIVQLDGLDAPPPPDGAPILSPQFPGFRFWVRITDQQGLEIPVREEPECIDETVCVSGALPGRSEAFLRVVGPKPNGRLWPTLVRFTTSTLEVWIEQVEGGEMRYYRLEGASPGIDDLTGLFDRQGFVPQ